MTTGRPSFFHVNLCTYADLGGSGSAIVEFVEMAIALADRAGIALRISLERQRPRRPKTGRKLTATSWRPIRAAVLAGEYGYLFVFNDSPSGLPQAPLPDRIISFGLAIHKADLFASALPRVRDPHARELLQQAGRITPRFANLAVAADIADDVLARTVQVARETFRQIDGACGFITLDPFQFISGDLTQYELSRRVYWATTLDLYQTHARGAFWGNFLSPRHVELLGGYAQVARTAPCALVEPLDFGANSTGAYLQLTAHPATAGAQQLEALARYLAPVLP